MISSKFKPTKSFFARIKESLKYNIVFSVALSGVLLAIIIILNFAFDLFKGFGGFSIQMFLVVFALGLYIIPNCFISFCFLVVTPFVLFALEDGAYVVNPMQVFIEYFFVFYVFFIMYFARIINSKANKKKYKYIELFLICFFYIICIIFKFLLHSVASHFYWNVPWIGALTYNALGSLANSSITLFFLVLSTPVILMLKEQYARNSFNKW